MILKKQYWLIALIVLFAACKEAFNPPVASPVTGYLVVEGFINSGNGASTITLTRTTKLVDSVATVYEHNAQVAIEDENSASYPLYEKDSGNYVSDNLPLNPALKYRLHITTRDGKIYQSDWGIVKQTPPIDSITWQLENGGVQIYINAHNSADAAKYYQLKYTETWEINSPYIKRLEYAIDPATNQVVGVYPLPVPDTAIYRCWITKHPSAINIVSTEKLTENKLYVPIRYIEPKADELSILYYIEVRQYALSREAYLFKQKLKKNTEQLGSIFDAQPSELGGNIHCISNPSEVVIGFVDVTQEQIAKLFIDNTEMSDWPRIIPCTEVLFENEPGNYNRDLIPTRAYEMRGQSIKSFYAAEPICVDCTLRGSNIKPPFWP